MYALRKRAYFLILLVAVLPLVGGSQGHAVESVRLSLGSLTGNGWSISNAQAALYLGGDGADRLRVTADTISLPGEPGTLTDVTLDCPAVELSPQLIRCRDGRLDADSTLAGRQRQLPVNIDYHVSDKQLTAELQGVRYLDGRVDLNIDSAADGWQLQLAGRSIAAPGLLGLLRKYVDNVPVLSASGRAGLTASLAGDGGSISRVRAELALNKMSFSDESGRYAGEDIGLQLRLTTRPRSNGWQVELTTRLEQGGIYIEPVYVEAGTSPLHAEADVHWHPRRQRLTVSTFRYTHPDALQVRASGVLELGESAGLHQASIEFDDIRLPDGYTTYVQPWLIGTLGGGLETLGRLEAGIELQDGVLSAARATLHGLDIGDSGGLFGFVGLTGGLGWRADDTPVTSTLQWDGGHVYSIELGGAQVAAESSGNALRLLRPASIPVLDGALEINSFSLSANDALRWDVDGVLTPVSMRRMTRAIGWQEFNGKLSGVIPAVRYEDGVLGVGGELQVRVFDGLVTLRDLRIEQPLGLVPRLQVDAHIDNIDLETLTGTFSFGRIEGRLDGRVDDLLLESWLPVAFDAEIGTPAGDRSRQRISQKAVDSISDIGGGGVGGALSRSYLSMFEDFPYDRLGIRCRLENGICVMGGVAPAQGGYYLVKGRFFPPRLDVIGHADRVDWDSLVSQIIAVTRNKKAVVQ